jgi:K+-sensing histidine kinase KdpD
MPLPSAWDRVHVDDVTGASPTGGPDPSSTNPGEQRVDRSVRSAVTDVLWEMCLPVAATGVVAFVLIPFGRPLAWLVLLAVVTGLGWLLGRFAGYIAAGVAGLSYLWVHGEPRFARVVTDQGTIRLGFLLGIVGAIAATLADWRQKVRSGRRPARRT